MATKTFKIGLSNTDKQNMAQDVYERVLALTFAEYDSANTYNKGDFVVYDDTLYQCKQDNTTGAWDSSKWQQATLQDLLNDIEGAVAFVNDKANVDGNYPTMTVGAADNLTPYDEDSGVDQEQPFLLQGTGCGNGEQQVDTGALGLLKEKQGHSVVVNQLVNGVNEGTTGNVTTTTTDNKTVILNGTSNGNAVVLSSNNIKIIEGHKYWFYLGNEPKGYVLIKDSNTWKNDAIFIFVASWSESGTLQIAPTSGEVFTNYALMPLVIDLTQWFGSNDNIPAHLLAHPEDFFRYYQGSLAYNEGTLVNSNGRYIKCIGRNQWDEDARLNYVYNSDGTGYSANGYLSSRNITKVIPNAEYYIKTSYYGSNNVQILYFDKDNNCIGYFNTSANYTLTIPSNVFGIKFTVRYSQGAITQYNHDITISIYYDGESGYDQYYPYEELANIDTGTEVLRSAGNVKDSKAPDGTITRRVGSVDLGSLDYSQYSDAANHIFRVSLNSQLNDIKRAANNSSLVNAICSIYQQKTYAAISASDNMCFTVSQDTEDKLVIINQAYSSNSAFKTAMSGVYLFYELATPTTEQGTTFSENVAIDDFGSMDFGGTNGVPQGASIFYAVDYKAFIDGLYNTLDGDATDIVKESELDSKLATLGYVKLTSVSGYDATKTQVLKNVEGTLTWVTEE